MPDGWHLVAHGTESFAPSYFGAGALWTRWTFAPGAEMGRQPPMVVDALTTPSAGDLSVYEAPNCYHLTTPSIEAPQQVSIGHGITARMFYANELAAQSTAGAAWVLLTWTWRVPSGAHGSFQRVTVLSHQGMPGPHGIPSPGPPGLDGSIRTTVSTIMRGASGLAGGSPDRSVVAALQAFSAGVVERQLVGSS